MNEVPSEIARLLSGTPHRVDAARRLSREAAADVLARARQAVHADALALEAAVGGTSVGKLTFGVDTIRHTPAFDAPLDRRTVATLAQVGLGVGGDGYELPTRLWLDGRGRAFAEPDLCTMSLVATSWGALVARALRNGGRVLDGAHPFVAELHGWDCAELAGVMGLPLGEPSVGDGAVVWDAPAAAVCFGTPAGGGGGAGGGAAVVSAPSLASLARVMLDAVALREETAARLPGEAPTLAFTRGAPGAFYRGRVGRVLAVVPSPEWPRRVVLFETVEGAIDWWTLDEAAADPPWA